MYIKTQTRRGGECFTVTIREYIFCVYPGNSTKKRGSRAKGMFSHTKRHNQINSQKEKETAVDQRMDNQFKISLSSPFSLVRGGHAEIIQQEGDLVT